MTADRKHPVMECVYAKTIPAKGYALDILPASVPKQSDLAKRETPAAPSGSQEATSFLNLWQSATVVWSAEEDNAEVDRETETLSDKSDMAETSGQGELVGSDQEIRPTDQVIAQNVDVNAEDVSLGQFGSIAGTAPQFVPRGGIGVERRDLAGVDAAGRSAPQPLEPPETPLTAVTHKEDMGDLRRDVGLIKTDMRPLSGGTANGIPAARNSFGSAANGPPAAPDVPDLAVKAGMPQQPADPKIVSVPAQDGAGKGLLLQQNVLVQEMNSRGARAAPVATHLDTPAASLAAYGQTIAQSSVPARGSASSDPVGSDVMHRDMLQLAQPTEIQTKSQTPLPQVTHTRASGGSVIGASEKPTALSSLTGISDGEPLLPASLTPAAEPSRAPLPEFRAPVMAEMVRIIPQLRDLVVVQRSGVMDVQLVPEELGALRIVFSSSEMGGTLNVQLSAERPETADLLRRHIDEFSRQLIDMGFDDVAFEFGGGTENQQRHEEGRRDAELPANDALPTQTHTARHATSGVDIRL